MTARILALVPYLPGTTASQRTSIEAWIPALEDNGFAVTVAPFESERLHDILYERGRRAAKAGEMTRSYWRRIRMMSAELSRYDAVFVHREAALIGPEVLERWAGHRGARIIYDLDDPLFVPYRSPTNGAYSRLKFLGKIGRLCSLADSVIVNNAPMRHFAERYSSNVWVVPNLVDGALSAEGLRRNRLPRRHDGPVRLGWIGSHSSAPNLDLIVEPLRQLALQASFEVVLVGAGRHAMNGVPHASRPWSATTELEDLRSIDIGLVPMAPHPWNPWKFSYKLAQYMSLGIPSVCSPVGSIPDQIEHGVTGFLAATSDEWVGYLDKLIDDTELRQSMGAAAHAASDRFTLDANRASVVGAFDSALKSRTGLS